MYHDPIKAKDKRWNPLAALYKNHIVTLQERTRDVLACFQMDALLIHSGELVNVFLDDHPYPFKVNPQFKAWCL